ncbi:type IV secretory system conjugative DNA transfer family protein (plasmid) [Skermanella sp. TT6]|uniref:Type IV secretory system conjugative DNA transfer family protein n=1 Tax=Skermanella cutis TaxID=2775420 RepID=A0ABX7BI18_9PROT|nr:type IV secretory system conjugative DNA transfer family protein [Skermanella sp. TT6]QQP94015.1 type IV secretory system conjugative DNA transfer family protein [Skermanella sp. TT6]
MIDLGQILTNPEPFVQATRTWIETNAVLLAGCAAGALTVAGVAGVGAGYVVDRLRDAAEDRQRYGGKREAKRAGLLRNPKLEYSGIPLGRIGRKHLCWVDQEPVLVTGGTRSGKGVGVIRPACLTYGGPMVMYDGGKGELFRTTSGWRKRFSHVLNLDLTNPAGVHFNFLEEIDPANPVAGADNLAKSVPRPARSDEHFEAGADRLMGAVILHVLHGEPDERKNMAEVVRLISQGDVGMRRIAETKAHPVAVDRINALFGGDPFGEKSGDGMKYRGMFYNAALVRLSPFEDPIVARVTGRSDFRMRDLFRLSPKRRPVSLYLTTPASDDDRLRPVTSMFLSMLMGAIMREQPALEGEPMSLLVVDEFASLRLEILQTAITKIVGCGATMLLGAQSLNALRQAPYGPYNQFRDNIRCHVVYAANDGMTQQEISQSCGTVTERRRSTSRSRSSGTWARSHTESVSEVEQPVINPGGVRQLRDRFELVLITGQPVIRARKIVDHKDRILRKRLDLPQAALRGSDGAYPDLPHPHRPSAWAGVPVHPQTPEAMASGAGAVDDGDLPEPPANDDATAPPARPKPRRKRKLITAPGGEE